MVWSFTLRERGVSPCPVEMLIKILVKGVSGEGPASPPNFQWNRNPTSPLWTRISWGAHIFVYSESSSSLMAIWCARGGDSRATATGPLHRHKGHKAGPLVGQGPLHLSGGPQGMTEPLLGLLKPSCLQPWEAPSPRMWKICDTKKRFICPGGLKGLSRELRTIWLYWKWKCVLDVCLPLLVMPSWSMCTKQGSEHFTGTQLFNPHGTPGREN